MITCPYCLKRKATEERLQEHMIKNHNIPKKEIKFYLKKIIQYQ